MLDFMIQIYFDKENGDRIYVGEILNSALSKVNEFAVKFMNICNDYNSCFNYRRMLWHFNRNYPEYKYNDEGVESYIVDKILILVNERIDARKNKDWEKADLIRKEIEDLGYKLEDAPDGGKILKIEFPFLYMAEYYHIWEHPKERFEREFALWRETK